MEALRLQIEDIILGPDETATATVVAVISASPIGAEVVAAGFGGKLDEAARASFAEFCIVHNALDVLRAVVEAPSTGINYKTTCCYSHHFFGSVQTGGSQPLHMTAVQKSNPQALRLALAWDPKERCLSKSVATFGGTLHFHALIKIFTARDQESAVECCRILMAARAPIHEKRPGAAIASGLFFDDDGWDRKRSPLITGLLAEYIAAGEIDLNVAPEGLKDPFNGMLPLRAAMAQGNIDGAVACIDLGCDIAKAMEFKCSGKPDDVLELARLLDFDDANDPGEMKSQMVAGITAAVMRRALREKSMEQSPSPISTTLAPGRRRMSI